ncbi:MAG: 4-hydroxy-tetrahydrodipicolinate reductase [Promethearchaeota archaeon]
MIKLLILGATGSMGILISKLALLDEDIDVIAACDVNNIGNELGTIVGVPESKRVIIQNPNELTTIISDKNPDVVVDFSVAEATEKNCMICVENGIRTVIGTTGLSDNFLKNFENKVKEKKAPSVISSNMATGVNVLFKIAENLTSYLGEWDIEVIEAHHHRKLDSPSGTALTLAKNISNSLGVKLEDVAKYGRDKGPNKRQVGAKNEIGILSVRAGDIVGDHTILYAGPGERIELKHQAHSRECFANGSIKAIKFIAKATENKIYSTNEVLEL